MEKPENQLLQKKTRLAMMAESLNIRSSFYKGCMETDYRDGDILQCISRAIYYHIGYGGECVWNDSAYEAVLM
jgi:hypothetical protein